MLTRFGNLTWKAECTILGWVMYCFWNVSRFRLCIKNGSNFRIRTHINNELLYIQLPSPTGSWRRELMRHYVTSELVIEMQCIFKAFLCICYGELYFVRYWNLSTYSTHCLQYLLCIRQKIVVCVEFVPFLLEWWWRLWADHEWYESQLADSIIWLLLFLSLC